MKLNFDKVREEVFGGRLTPSQFEGLQILLAAIPSFWKLSWAATMFGQVTWETAHTMQPVREAFWLSEEWRKIHLRYYPFYGRGFCQLTWDYNYRFFSHVAGVDLVANPDKAMDPDIAAKIVIAGMEWGKFTGKKLEEYDRDSGSYDFIGSRAIINGSDKAQTIAIISRNYLSALSE